MLRPPPRSLLSPSTTLFRSPCLRADPGMGDAREAPGRAISRKQPAATTRRRGLTGWRARRSEEHTSELQSLRHLVCRLLLEKKKKMPGTTHIIHTCYISATD